MNSSKLLRGIRQVSTYGMVYCLVWFALVGIFRLLGILDGTIGVFYHREVVAYFLAIVFMNVFVKVGEQNG